MSNLTDRLKLGLSSQLPPQPSAKEWSEYLARERAVAEAIITKGRCPKCGSADPVLYAENCQNNGRFHYAFHRSYVVHPWHYSGEHRYPNAMNMGNTHYEVET